MVLVRREYDLGDDTTIAYVEHELVLKSLTAVCSKNKVHRSLSALPGPLRHSRSNE